MTRVIIEVDVHDQQELYQAALAVACKDVPEAEAEAMLRPEGEVDVAACLIMVFDPGVSPAGVSINETYVSD